MRLGLVAIVLCSGCELIVKVPEATLVGADAPQLGDGGGDAIPPDARLCYGSFRSLCLPAPIDPESVVDLTGPIDTATFASCTVLADPGTPSAGELCVLIANAIAIAAGTTVAVTGTRPLVLLARSTITIDGTLDLAAHGAVPGPAAHHAECTFTPPSGISGGAGGSRGGTGGSGGNGTDGNGGVAGMPPVLSLLGGCPGGIGNGSAGGPPGAGGGSALLIAGDELAIAGTITASGSGGTGGQNTVSAGGGAGSGGVIVLDAPSARIAGIVVAAGGGGGEGGRGSISGSGGNSGASPDPLTPTVAANGGSGGLGGDGGAGALAGNGANGDRSGAQFVTGGGGGGASGIVHVVPNPATITGTVLPPPQ